MDSTRGVCCEEDIYLTIPKRKKKTIKVNLEYDGPVNAPITKGQKLGKMIVAVSDEIVKEARDSGVYVEYLLFDDEGHGFIKKENQIEGYKKILNFLNNYLNKV